MGFTKNYADTILQDLFSGAYIALGTGAPTETTDSYGKVSYTLNEASGEGYERVAASVGEFKPDSGKIKNSKYIYFPEATQPWGTISHMYIVTDKNPGNDTLRYFGALNQSVPVPANTVPLFKPNTINISLDAD